MQGVDAGESLDVEVVTIETCRNVMMVRTALRCSLVSGATCPLMPYAASGPAQVTDWPGLEVRLPDVALAPVADVVVLAPGSGCPAVVVAPGGGCPAVVDEKPRGEECLFRPRLGCTLGPRHTNFLRCIAESRSLVGHTRRTRPRSR